MLVDLDLEENEELLEEDSLEISFRSNRRDRRRSLARVSVVRPLVVWRGEIDGREADVGGGRRVLGRRGDGFELEEEESLDS